jgi:uncharacterized protein
MPLPRWTPFPNQGARRSTALGLMLVVWLFAPALAQDAMNFETSGLVVETSEGRASFVVELALSAEQKTIGLMGRKMLPPGKGMLFDFETPRMVSMWMRNTYIPLDMIFIDSDGRIVNIAENRTPLSLATIPSAAPVRGVLEVGAGVAEKYGIRPGDRVVHSIFGNAGLEHGR